MCIRDRIGSVYQVENVVVDERLTRRLEALGVNEGTFVTVMNKKGSGTLIIKVRGTRLALGRRIADGKMCIRDRISYQEAM